jgi:Ca-activated chloride channel family protein
MTKPLPRITDEEMARSPAGDAEAGFGALATARGCLPLAALDVRARVEGLLARVEVRQTFVNAHAEPLEASYIFPLPERAAVTRFRLEVGGRVIEGALKERGEARREYDRAVRAGHRAAITEEDRPGVFTLRVGNLPPGEEARVLLTLVGPLPYAGGEAMFRFPLVVAARYVPGVPLPGPCVGDGVAPDTDAAPDASRISPPVLLPGFPNPVRLSLSVEVPPSPLELRSFRSSLHTVVEERAGRTLRLCLQPGERLDRDFVLRFRAAEDRIATSLVLEPDADGREGTFLLTLIPPASEWEPEPPTARGRDVAFVLDRSGSMAGWKIVAARRALARMVDTLTQRDRFTVYAFDHAVEVPPGFDGGLVPATDRQRFQAVEFLAGLADRGGTEMAAPLVQAVSALTSSGPHEGRQRILVLVTDGQVANEDQILRELGPRARGVRVFALGIDRAVNAAFLRRLADLGGGSSELVESEERLDEVMAGMHRHLGTPVLTDLRLGPAGLHLLPGTLVPGRLPDLFAGAPLFVLGRYRGAADGAVNLSGQDGEGRPWSARLPAWRGEGGAASAVWARVRLRELEDRYVVTGGSKELEQEIVATSLRFGVLCRFTAFVAVDRTAAVNPGGQVHQVVQPVEAPAGWADERPPLLRGLAGAPAYMARTEAADFGLARGDDEVCCARESLSECEKVELDYWRGASESVRASAPGLLRRMFSAFRRMARRRTDTTPALDRDGCRQRARDLLQALSASPADAQSRLTVLRSLARGLEELVRGLRAAGDMHPSVERLGEVLLRLQVFLGRGKGGDAAVHALWAEVESALQAWVASEAPPPPSPPARPEGFWK